MAEPLTTQRCLEPSSGSTTGVHRSAAPELRVAQIAIGIALVAVVLDGFVSLVAAAVTGWAIGIDPAGRAAAFENLTVSAAVTGLLTSVLRMATAVWGLFVLMLVLAGIAVVRWQSAALANLAALSLGRPRSAFWAAAAWVIPIWSLIGPKRTFNALWRGSEPLRGPGDQGAGEPVRVPAFHSLWWLLWVGAVLLNGWGALRMTHPPTLGTVLSGQLILVAVDVGLVGAGLLLQRILTLTTARQDACSAAA
jgi:hypothetical protein